MTIREYMSTQILTGLLSNSATWEGGDGSEPYSLPKEAVGLADELIKELQGVKDTTGRGRRALELHDAGLTLKEVGAALDISRGRAGEIVHAERRRLNREEALKMYEAGKTVEEIGASLDWSPATVSLFLHSHRRAQQRSGQ